MLHHVLRDFPQCSDRLLFFSSRKKIKLNFISLIVKMYNTPGFRGFFGSSLRSLDSATVQSVVGSSLVNRNYFMNNGDANEQCLLRKVVCGELRLPDVGACVEICGRMQSQRLGRFLSLRDDTGITQLVVPDDRFDVQKRLKNTPLNSYLVLRGFVTARPDKSRNEKMATGDIEVLIDNLVSVHPKRKLDNSDGENDLRKYLKKAYVSSSSFKLTSEELSKCPTPALIRHFSQRSHTCSELNKHLVGKSITLCGWVSAKRVGRFVMLKDGYGSVQIVPEIQNIALTNEFQNLNVGSILVVKGVVSRRPPGHENPRIENGNIEILVESLTVVNTHDPVPPGEESKGGDNDNNDGNSNSNEKFMIVKQRHGTEAISPDSNKYTWRTHTCGELDDIHVGQNVRLMGWVEYSRMNKFILLRDSYGKTQLIIPESRIDLQNLVEELTFESVLLAEGTVCSRPPGQENTKQKTGKIEVSVENLKVLNKAKSLPFYVREFNKPHEQLRLKYRYLDLRFENMQYNLRLRSKTLHKIRCFLIEHMDFVEVETPTLFKRTPGGAQEFIVPTVEEGKFYSLVQSPQQFKQLLMVGSVDRYFQIAHCYRDEASRNDRQPEFTQLDIEMSFCDREGVLTLIEDLLKYCWPKNLPPLVTPFPRITYEEALNSYGTDKPDLRFSWLFENITNVFIGEKDNCKGKFDIQNLINEPNFVAYSFVGRQGGIKLTEETRKQMQNEMKAKYPSVGFLFFKIKSLKNMQDTLETIFCSSVAKEIKNATDYDVDDVLFLALGPKNDVLESLGKIRVQFADHLERKNMEVFTKNTFNFLWVLDFPLFEKVHDIIQSTHHPFTQPHPEDIQMLDTNPLQVRSLHYDLVLNGNEIGGGSIRVQDYELQRKILKDILKVDIEPISHLLEGLASGAPPHGGIALGLDRLMAILCGAQSIRDVMAFPKAGFGKDPMTNTPCDISEEEKKRYHIS